MIHIKGLSEVSASIFATFDHREYFPTDFFWPQENEKNYEEEKMKVSQQLELNPMHNPLFL